MDKKCDICGSLIEEGQFHCPKCGSNLLNAMQEQDYQDLVYQTEPDTGYKPFQIQDAPPKLEIPEETQPEEDTNYRSLRTSFHRMRVASIAAMAAISISAVILLAVKIGQLEERPVEEAPPIIDSHDVGTVIAQDVRHKVTVRTIYHVVPLENLRTALFGGDDQIRNSLYSPSGYLPVTTVDQDGTLHNKLLNVPANTTLDHNWDDFDGLWGKDNQAYGSLIRIRRDGKYGFIDRSGKEVCPPRYDDTGVLAEGAIWVRLDGKYGFIDKTGNEFAEPKWDYVEDYHDGFAMVGVQTNGVFQYGFIDETGGIISAPQWDYASDFNSSVALVKKGELYGFIDNEGVLSQPQWDSATWEFSEGLAEVQKDGKWGYINYEGSLAIPLEWDGAEQFSQGLAAVKLDGKWGYIDTDGAVVVEPYWDWTWRYWDGLALVQLGNQYGFLDLSGEIVIEPEWDRFLEADEEVYFKGGYAIGQKDSLYGIVNDMGKIITEPQWDSVRYFSDGFAVVELDDKYGYVDTLGNVLMEPIFESAEDFSDGVALVVKDGIPGILSRAGILIQDEAVTEIKPFDPNTELAPFKKNGLWGYMDKTGSVVIPPQWDEVTAFGTDNFAVVRKGEMYNFIDHGGELLYEGWWDHASLIPGGYPEVYLVGKGGKYGFVSADGAVLLEPKYDWIMYFPEGNMVAIEDLKPVTDNLSLIKKAESDWEHGKNAAGNLETLKQYQVNLEVLQLERKGGNTPENDVPASVETYPVPEEEPPASSPAPDVYLPEQSE